MAVQNKGPAPFTCGGTIARGAFVKIQSDSTIVVTDDATDDALGVALEDGVSGQIIAVALRGSGIQKVICGDTIAVGDSLKLHSEAGKVVPLVDEYDDFAYQVATAIEAGSAGELISAVL